MLNWKISKRSGLKRWIKKLEHIPPLVQKKSKKSTDRKHSKKPQKNKSKMSSDDVIEKKEVRDGDFVFKKKIIRKKYSSK